jgi:hypothetical protein
MSDETNQTQDKRGLRNANCGTVLPIRRSHVSFPANNASSFVLLITDHRLLQQELVLLGDPNPAFRPEVYLQLPLSRTCN